MTAPFRSSRPRLVPRSPAGRRHPPRKRWRLRTYAAASVFVLAASGVGHAMFTGVESGIGRVDAFKGMGMNDRPGGGSGLNFLVVGTDRRDKLSKEEKDRYHLGGEPCHCTDTLMLVHLSADRSRASVVSLPRDSYAEVPTHTDEATGRPRPRHAVKLNAAYAEGGPSLTVRTVEHMTGVHIDHYLEVDFTSFMRSVDAVGGVEICTVRPLQDSYSGLDLPAGKTVLNGGQALQYVRARHLDGSADLGRIQRQQRFLAALIDKITSSGVLMNPIRFKDVTDTILESVRADDGFDADDMADLGQAMRHFTPSSSEFTSVPLVEGTVTVPGVGSTVRWDPVQSRQLFDAIRQDKALAGPPAKKKPPATLVDVPPSRIRVQVDNGTAKPGLDTTVADQLHATGFTVTGTPGEAADVSGNAGRVPGDGAGAPSHAAADAGVPPSPSASPAPADTPRTVIAYDPRWNRSARSLAAALPGAELRAVAGQGPVMRVTVGRDFTAVRPVRAEEPPQQSDGFSAITGDEAVCA